MKKKNRILEVVKTVTHSTQKINQCTSSVQNEIHVFEKEIQKDPSILFDKVTCPLFIILVGMWSSYNKKVRTYSNPDFKGKEATNFLFLCLKICIKYNVDPNIVQNHMHKSNALQWIIAWDRSYEGVELINLIKSIQQYWNPNTKDAYNRSHISLLSARKYFGRKKLVEQEDNLLIQLLIKNKIEVDSRDVLGNTLLHYVFLKRDVYVLRLIKNNYDYEKLLYDRNIDDQTPEDYLKLDYNRSANLIRDKVYVAAKSEHIFNQAKFSERNEKFIQEIKK